MNPDIRAVGCLLKIPEDHSCSIWLIIPSKPSNTIIFNNSAISHIFCVCEYGTEQKGSKTLLEGKSGFTASSYNTCSRCGTSMSRKEVNE